MEKGGVEEEFNLAEIKFKDGYYQEAVKLCNNAISIEPGIAKYHCLLSKCLVEQKQFDEAMEECNKAISLDNGFVEAHRLRSEILLSAGNFQEAVKSLRNAIDKHLPNESLIQEQLETCQQIVKSEGLAQRYMELKQYQKALGHIDTIRRKLEGCHRVEVLRAECMVHLGFHAEVERFINQEGNVQQSEVDDDLYLKALLAFYSGRMDSANELCCTILRNNRHHRKTIDLQNLLRSIESIFGDASERVNQEKFLEARIILKNGFQLANNNLELKRTIYLHRSKVHIKLKAYLDAISDCTSAINIDESKPDAYIIRAAAYEALNVPLKAESDRDIAKRLENKEGINLFDMKPETTDDYKQIAEKLKSNSYPSSQILNVRLDATEKDIRSAHSKLVRKYHPDQFAKRPELRPYCEEIFMKVKEACNDMLRRQDDAPDEAL